MREQSIQRLLGWVLSRGLFVLGGAIAATVVGWAISTAQASASQQPDNELASKVQHRVNQAVEHGKSTVDKTVRKAGSAVESTARTLAEPSARAEAVRSSAATVRGGLDKVQKGLTETVGGLGDGVRQTVRGLGEQVKPAAALLPLPDESSDAHSDRPVVAHWQPRTPAAEHTDISPRADEPQNEAHADRETKSTTAHPSASASHANSGVAPAVPARAQQHAAGTAEDRLGSTPSVPADSLDPHAAGGGSAPGAADVPVSELVPGHTGATVLEPAAEWPPPQAGASPGSSPD